MGADEFHYRDCGIAGGWPHPASAHADEAAEEAVARAIQQADYEWEVAAGCQMPVGDPWHHIARGFLATPVVADAFRDAERLRNLAARFEGHLNRGQTFTGAQIAAMLRSES